MPTRSVLHLLAVLSSGAVFACGGAASSPASSTQPDAALPDGNAHPDTDAGTPATDAGAVATDAGETAADAGVTADADAGTPDAGGVAAGNDAGTPAPPTLIGLAVGAVVSGHLALNASTASDTTRVDFQLDGATFAAVTAAPFSTTWDSFAAANGAHTLSFNATGAAGTVTASIPVQVTLGNHLKNVFVIVMENNDWSSIKGSSSAPYINGTLLVQGAHAEKYLNVPNLHPSLPNYLWLESGSNQGVTDDDVPANHQLNKQHLVGLLHSAGVTWKSYQEDISGLDCPLDYVNQYAPKHNPMVYFTDVNGGADPSNPYCIAHVRPYSELTNDLEANTAPAYSFITPNLCNDMHDCGVGAGDAWLAREIPKIMGSKAYREGGAIFVTWDESAGSNVPIGFIALSPLAKAGYASQVAYTHSSTLRSMEEIFGVTPLLNGAATATNLSDLFRSFP